MLLVLSIGFIEASTEPNSASICPGHVRGPILHELGPVKVTGHWSLMSSDELHKGIVQPILEEIP